MTRLLEIDTSEACYRFLNADDTCLHYGEYISRGKWGAGETNQQIANLKKKPTASPAELQYKARAIRFWAQRLSSCLNLDVCAESVTFVPMPPSKPRKHAEYDDRMLKVARKIAVNREGIDIRELLTQSAARTAQHESERRLTAEEIQDYLAVNLELLDVPLRPSIIILDDVITRGASFRAAKNLLSDLPGVQDVFGVFLAKTVWPTNPEVDFEAIL